MRRPILVQRPTTGLAEQASAEEILTLRVATWNLQSGRNRGGGRLDVVAAADAIVALDADVVAVQEVDRAQPRSGGVDQLAALADRLGWHAVFAPTVVGRLPTRGSACKVVDGEPAGYGIGLLSRYPLTGSAPIVLPTGGCGGLVADAEARVVLPCTVSTALSPVQIWATHLSWTPARAWRQLRTVLSRAAGAGPVVLVGDLNLPGWLVRPAAAAAGWQAARGGASFPASLPTVQLDHIVVRNARLGDVRIAPRGVSDHRPVSATIMIENRADPPDRERRDRGA